MLLKHRLEPLTGSSPICVSRRCGTAICYRMSAMDLSTRQHQLRSDRVQKSSLMRWAASRLGQAAQRSRGKLDVGRVAGPRVPSEQVLDRVAQALELGVLVHGIED